MTCYDDTPCTGKGRKAADRMTRKQNHKLRRTKRRDRTQQKKQAVERRQAQEFKRQDGCDIDSLAEDIAYRLEVDYLTITKELQVLTWTIGDFSKPLPPPIPDRKPKNKYTQPRPQQKVNEMTVGPKLGVGLEDLPLDVLQQSLFPLLNEKEMAKLRPCHRQLLAAVSQSDPKCQDCQTVGLFDPDATSGPYNCATCDRMVCETCTGWCQGCWTPLCSRCQRADVCHGSPRGRLAYYDPRVTCKLTTLCADCFFQCNFCGQTFCFDHLHDSGDPCDETFSNYRSPGGLMCRTCSDYLFD